MSKIVRKFSDLDLNFTPHPVTGDIVRRFDDSAIKAAVRNLVLTAHYERPFHSELGSPVRGLLFEIPTPILAQTMRKSIIDLITNFEPRVVVDDVFVRFFPDNNEITITIEFTIVNTSEPLSVDVILERTR